MGIRREGGFEVQNEGVMRVRTEGVLKLRPEEGVENQNRTGCC